MPKNILLLLTLLSLLACGTNPAKPQPQVVTVVQKETELLTPPQGLLRPCYLPPSKKPRSNEEALKIYLDWKASARKCAAGMEKLIKWYSNAEANATKP